MRKWVATIFWCYQGTLFAGQTVGNGGYIAECGLGRPQMLEVCEAKLRRNLVPDLGSPDLSVEEKVAIAIERLRRLDPERAARWEEQLENFWQETLIVEYSLEKIAGQDLGEVDSPGIYNIQRIAVRQIPQSPLDYKYLINYQGYHSLDNTNKAILVLHEIIATEAKATRRHLTTQRVRFFLGTLVSNLFDLQPTRYLEILSYTRMNAYLGGESKYSRWVLFEETKLPYEDAQSFCSNLDIKYGQKYDIGYFSEGTTFPMDSIIFNFVRNLPEGENILLSSSLLGKIGEFILAIDGKVTYREVDGKTPRLFVCYGKDTIE